MVVQGKIQNISDNITWKGVHDTIPSMLTLKGIFVVPLDSMCWLGCFMARLFQHNDRISLHFVCSPCKCIEGASLLLYISCSFYSLNKETLFHIGCTIEGTISFRLEYQIGCQLFSQRCCSFLCKKSGQCNLDQFV